MNPWTVDASPAVFAVRQPWRFRDHVDDVHPESVDPFIEPPGHHIVHFAADLRILPVQVRLLLGEHMKIIFARGFIEFPGGSAKERTPVVRGLAVFAGMPNIIIPVWIILRFARFHEPVMLIRAVIDDQVHDQLHAPCMQSIQQLLPVLHRSKRIHDQLIIANIVPIIVVWRLIHRA
ncbi:hypothetical protein D3C74_279780 [compost metagenome]